MTSEKIENDYDVNLKVNKEIFHYETVKKLPILLKGHVELPQNYKFISPKLSKDGKYITSIGKSKNEKDGDIIYFWNARNLSILFQLKGISKIELVEFSPDQSIFVIIYKDQPPVFFDFHEGKELSRCEDKKIKHTKVISYSFSKKGEHFAMATDKDFVLYNVKKGKLIRQIISDAPIKVFRGKKIAFIDLNFNVKIMDVKTCTLIKEFQLTGIGEGEIIYTMMSPDKNEIYFIKKDGVYKLSIENIEIIKVKEIDKEVIHGLISEDCAICMTTDMSNVEFWDLKNRKLMGNIIKEKFHSFSVNFSQSKLLVSDDICIDLTDISDNRAEQKYIWLDLNPNKFMSYVFSPDYKVLLAKIDEYSAISYNCTNGNVIKKWKINLPNWYKTCEMAPENSKYGVIATKSYNNIVKLWDYLTGTDLSTFIGFDPNKFAFSKNGQLLAAGTVKGREIARVWNISYEKIYKFYFDGGNNNKNTIVNISHSEPLKIIAVAEEQNPLIFDLEKQELITECTDCSIQFTSLIDVQSNEGNKNFYIYGKDINNINTAILYDFNGTMINEYNICRNIEFGKEDKYLLTDSDNINKGLLTISHLNVQDGPKEIECSISGVNSRFLSDNKSIATLLDTEEDNKKKIIITDVETGETIGEINFEKKTNKYTEIYLTANKEEKYLLFRFIELENPINKEN